MDINKLTQKDIGRWVVYHKGWQGANKENGKLKSWNDERVFVVYNCDDDWKNFKNYTGCATNPEDLSFMNIKD